jgi:type I restriction enzyme, S subunit
MPFVINTLIKTQNKYINCLYGLSRMSPTSQQLIPKLRFSEFSGSWEEKRLSEVCERIMDWTHFSPKSVGWNKMYITSKNIRNTWLDLANCNYISQEEHEVIYKRCPVKFWDVLLTKDWANTGNCCINSLHEEFSLLSSVAVLVWKDWILDNFFLLQILQSDKGICKITDTMAGQAISRITLDKIKKFKFCFPSINEQTEIASFLSAVDEKIQQLTDLKSARKNYKKSMMKQIFSQHIRFRDDKGKYFPEWEEKQLGEIAEIKTGNLNVEDAINDGEFVFFDRSEEVKKYNKYSFDNEALIYAWEWSKFLPRYFSGKYGLHQRSYTIFNVKNTNMIFLYYFMLTQNNHFLKLAVWSTVKSLRMDCFEKCIIKSPSLPEQKEVATFLSQIDVKISEYSDQIEQAKQWKKWLLQGLFI